MGRLLIWCLVFFLLSLPTLYHAVASGGWIRWDLCKHESGEELGKHFALDGIKTKSHFWARDGAVQQVIPRPDDDKCSILITATGRHIVVVGSLEEIFCKLDGGPECEKSFLK